MTHSNSVRLILLVATLPCAAVTAAAQAGPTTIASVSSTGTQANFGSFTAVISGDGRIVAFYSSADNLVPADGNAAVDVFVHDPLSGATELVNVSTSGVQGNSGSLRPSLSRDGRYVTFETSADNLVPGDTNALIDIFVRDRQSGTTEMVSVATDGALGDAHSRDSFISADGRFVVFRSQATTLVAGDANGTGDVFLRDRQLGTTRLVSLATGGVQGNGDCPFPPALSADGRFVAFQSYATNLVAGDTNGVGDIFVRDTLLDQTELVSVSTGGGLANGDSYWNPSLSADGRYVAFAGSASNLVPGDVNGVADVFVRDRTDGTTELVSVSTLGRKADDICTTPSLSADGRFVAFYGYATTLVPGDTNLRTDVFVRDLQNGTTVRASVSSAGAQGNGHCDLFPSISADGRLVAFASESTNLVLGDANGVFDVFVHETNCMEPAIYCTAKTNSAGCTPSIDSSGVPSVSTPSNFVVTASSVLNGKFGIFFWGRQPTSFPFSGGTLCVQPPIVRTATQASGGTPPPAVDCSGTYALHFSETYAAAQGLGPGDDVYCQFWSRDPGFAPPENIGLTNALHFTLCQ